MKLKFIGDPLELERGGALSRQNITLEGVTFRMGVVEDASMLSPRLQAKLRSNSHFEVVEESPAVNVVEAAPAAKPAGKGKAAAKPEGEAE